MPALSLLCVEPDEKVVQIIRSALEPHGFHLTNITSAEDAVAWSKKNMPQLAVVSVEPGKVGYNICNKFKRTNDLKEIPLLLISGQETPEQLEQHRKLKVRANEYLSKPFSAEALLEKVRLIYPLDGPGASSELLPAGDDIEEISIDDDDLVEEAMVADDAELDSGFDDAATRAVSSDDLEAALERETEAAFNALRAPDDEGPAGASVITAADRDPSSPFSLSDKEWEAAATAATAFEGITTPSPQAATSASRDPAQESARGGPKRGLDVHALFSDAATRAVPDARIAHSMLAVLDQHKSDGPVRAEDDNDGAFDAASLEISSDDVATRDTQPVSVAAPAASTSKSSAPLPGDTAFEVPAIGHDGTAAPPPPEALAEFTMAGAVDVTEVPRPPATTATPKATAGVEPEIVATMRALEAEVENLRRENEVLRSGVHSSSAERNKAIFDLREQLSRKDKELLDLQEQLAQRERQDLDRKDRLLALEREKRDLAERSLGLEKSLVQTTERLDAAIQDKERLAEKERITRARLEDAHSEIAKSHEEIASLKKRAASTEEKLRAENDRLRGEMENRIAALEQKAAAERARAAQERADAEAAIEQAHQAEIGQLREAHAAALQGAVAKADQERRALEVAHENELSRLRREHEQALASLKEEHRGQLQAEREAQQAAAEARERDHRNEILGMRKRHEEELLAADERRKRDLAEAEERSNAALEAAEERRRMDLKQRDEEQHAKLAEIDRQHFQEKTELQERHRSELDQALGRVAQVEGELAARLEELTGIQRRLQRVESDLDAAKTELRERQVRLSQAQARISELEQKTLSYEEQIMRTFQRMRADERAVNKAKRALAVAISLLEERGVNDRISSSGETGAGATPVGEASRSDTDETAKTG